MADSLYTPQVDYTSRDYASLRDDLIAIISNFAPQWTSRDSSDFGIVLIELFSYLGDILNYQIDRAANESFIDTATQRETVLRLASLLGYTPNGMTAATGTVSIYNSSASSVTVPSGAVVSTISDGVTPSINFTIDTGATISATSTSTFNVTQGELSSSAPIGISDGTELQSFALPDTGVIVDGSMVITVGNVTYSRVEFLVDYGTDDPVYTTYTDSDGITYIEFGDGTSGRIPPNGQVISAIYRYTTTAASLGNVGSGTITVIDTTSLTGSNINVQVTNSNAMSGGTDAESTDSIRINAPKALRSLNRAVSTDDYANLALTVSGVAKAKAIATSFASVALYLAAANGGKASSTVKSNLLTYFTGKTPPGSSIALYDYTPAYPYLDATVAVLPQYSASSVSLNVESALASLFNFDNVTFTDFISEGDLYSAIKSVDGVSYVTINDYEKLPPNVNQSSGVYSQSATVYTPPTGIVSTTSTIAAGATTIPVNTASQSLLSTGLIGTIITGPATIPANTYVTGVTGTGVTISAAITTGGISASQALTFTVNTTIVATVPIAINGCGVMSNAIITQVGGSTTNGAVGQTVTNVTVNGTTAVNFITLNATTPTNITAGTVIYVKGANGTTAGARDLTCGVNEIPIYNADYFNITTTGGAS